MSTTLIPDEVVAAVRQRVAAGELIDDLAAELNISSFTIRSWALGRRRGAGRKRYTYLSDKDVRTFRVRASQAEPLARLAREFGLSLNAATKLVAGHRRKEAGGPLRSDWSPSRRLVYRREGGWTEEQDKWAMTLPAHVVAKRTGRSAGAVYARRTRIRAAASPGRTRAPRHRPWSADEEELLSLPAKVVAERTGRTVQSVYDRRCKLSRKGEHRD